MLLEGVTVMISMEQGCVWRLHVVVPLQAMDHPLVLTVVEEAMDEGHHHPGLAARGWDRVRQCLPRGPPTEPL